jgi:hypothetical protein
MKNEFLATLGSAVGVSYKLQELFFLLGNSILLGIVLLLVSYKTANTSKGHNVDALTPKEKAQLILGCSNVMFLCIGLTAVMILVNNNLARAFSIGAAIALVRFRIKIGQKSGISSILFSIIVGIACGLNEISLAWLLTIIYLISSLFLHLILKKVYSKSD